MPSLKSPLKSVVKSVVPLSLRNTARKLWHGDKLRPVRRLTYYGRSRYCPICGAHLRRFLPFRHGPDPLAVCPICYAHGRHRMFWLWLPRKTELLDGRPKKLLHFAPNGPERHLSQLLQKVTFIDYLSVDLYDPQAIVKVDITEISFPDDSFDIILCSHVLEHVPADRKAMAELFRVLKPGGWAILQVPITADETFEDPTVTDPHERARLFGQFDHVRRYGQDYRRRLEDAGFTIHVFPGSEEFTAEEIAHSELLSAEDQAIWMCRKPLSSSK